MTMYKEVKIKLIQRLNSELEAMSLSFEAIDAIDRLNDYHLIDQMQTARKLTQELNDLLVRMDSIVK